MTDVAIVGAGVVGLACAAELAAAGHEVLILERHDRIGTETSSRNSEVVHAGIYYEPGSLKARACVEGNARLWAFCEEHGVAHRKTGKLLVAVESGEEAELERIWARAEANGALGMTWLDAAEVRSCEPGVRAVRAILSTTSGIVDSHQLMAAYRRIAEGHGASVALRVRLTAVDRSVAGGYTLHVADADGEHFTFDAHTVINAAGLAADDVAAMAGFDVDALGYRQHYWPGHYYRLTGRLTGHVQHLIYPMPDQALVGLGIHVTLDLAGQLKLGPDAEYRPGRDVDYTFRDDRRDVFLRAAQRYLPAVMAADLMPDQVGIRPKLQRPGDPYRDFVVSEESGRGYPGWVNLLGIESPGLTCSPVLARHVAALLAPVLA